MKEIVIFLNIQFFLLSFVLFIVGLITLFTNYVNSNDQIWAIYYLGFCIRSIGLLFIGSLGMMGEIFYFNKKVLEK